VDVYKVSRGCPVTGGKIVIILLLEVFKGPIAALPATVFLSIVVRVLGNSG